MCCKKTSGVELHFEKRNVCIPRSFLVINVCNQGKTLCSTCTHTHTHTHIYIYIYIYIYILYTQLIATADMIQDMKL